jgi:uncharacterized protein YkwD
MKKLLVLLVLLVSGLGYSQSDSAWISKYPPIPESLQDNYDKDSIWWMSYKMDTTKFRLAIMDEINKERKKLGRKSVGYGTVEQTNSTQSYVNYESENHIVGHNSDLWGEDVISEVSAGNITTIKTFIVRGDNIYHYIAEKIVALWMGSSGHRYTIMREDFKTISAGICFRYVGTMT